MKKLAAILNLFRKGAVISDAALWKQRQVTATVLGSAIMAVVGVLNAYGYNLPIDNETALAIAGAMLGIINVFLTYVSSEKVGVGRSENVPDVSSRTDPAMEPEQVQQPELRHNEVPEPNEIRTESLQPVLQATVQHPARKEQDIYQN
jgi:hypothetical protein